MARPKRLKLKDEEGFFHIMSRTVGQEFYLGEVEKEKKERKERTKKEKYLIINCSEEKNKWQISPNMFVPLSRLFPGGIIK